VARIRRSVSPPGDRWRRQAIWGGRALTYRWYVSITLDLPKELIKKVQPILRDLGTADLDIRLSDAGWDAWWAESFVLNIGGTGGRGIQWGDGSRPEDLAAAMDTIQDEVCEARWAQGLPVSWPRCPGHEHVPLPRLIEGKAVWQCPNTMNVFAPIGGLGRQQKLTRWPSPSGR
jgi:hypothetical protein